MIVETSENQIFGYFVHEYLRRDRNVNNNPADDDYTDPSEP